MSETVTPERLLLETTQALLAEIGDDGPDFHWHPDMALPEWIEINPVAAKALLLALGRWSVALGRDSLASLAIWVGETALGDDPGSLVLQAGRRHPNAPAPSVLPADPQLEAIQTAAKALGATRVVPGIEDGTERVSVHLPDLLPAEITRAEPFGKAFDRRRLLLIRRPILTPARLARSMALTSLITEFVPDADAALARVAEGHAKGRPYDFVGLSAVALADRTEAVLQALRNAPGGDRLQIVVTGADERLIDHPHVDAVLCAGKTSDRLLDAIFDLIRRARPGEGREATNGEVPSLAGRHILIVEDVAMNRALMQAMLSPTGATLSLAADGESGIEAMRNRPADIVLMDIAMPRMDGLQATRRIKEIAPQTTIIALTAHARGEDRSRYLAAGMDDYMAKPIRVDDLYNALRRAVA